MSNVLLEEIKKIVEESAILKEDDKLWPQPDKVGRQELEILLGNKHITFTTSKFGSFSDIKNNKDAEGLTVYYYLI